MTGSSMSGGPAGPPWSVDLLADLHAGALDDAVAAQLWPRVNADPEAKAVIEALDVIKVELGQLGSAQPEPMPAHFAAKLDAALDAEARRTTHFRPAAPAPAPRAPVVDLAEARKRRNRRMAWGAGVLTAAAAAVALAVVLVPGSNKTDGSAVAGSDGGNSGKPPLAVTEDNLSAAIGGVNNERDYGPLKDQARLDECIKANDLDPAKAQTVGVRQVTLDGKQGVMALLTTGQVRQFRVLIVEPTCGPGNPGTLANTLIPG
jgi:hypothetical protein